MEMAFTAVFKKVPEGYIAFVEELAGANSQGATLAEARENLREGRGDSRAPEDRRVKRRTLVRHLESHGCELLREGGRHSVYVNRRTRKVSTVPRHREINEHLARKICRDLEVTPPVA
jgi:predicted RNA binding protein YcfA (HicA-like mRNA interferase family)